jgi:hypothetical protein
VHSLRFLVFLMKNNNNMVLILRYCISHFLINISLLHVTYYIASAVMQGLYMFIIQGITYVHGFICTEIC